jgi:DNA-binding HxlR family transcriptional regulator
MDDTSAADGETPESDPPASETPADDGTTEAPQQPNGEFVVDYADAAEAFAAVGNEYRLRIVTELAETWEWPVPYSELRRRLDESDRGRLNYHLNELVGAFVWKEADEGYGLTQSGRRLASSVTAGRYHDDDRTRSTTAPGACVYCDATALRLEQPAQRGTLVCTACETELVDASFPVGAWNGRPAAEVPRVFDEYIVRISRSASRGICPACAGAMVAEPVPEVIDFSYAMGHACTACPRATTVPFGTLAWLDDTVRTFLHRAGVDTDDRPFWTVPAMVDDDTLTVVSTDPVSVEVTFEVDDARCVATVDDTGTVTHVREEWDLG